jgi:hypothetical protein
MLLLWPHAMIVRVLKLPVAVMVPLLVDVIVGPVIVFPPEVVVPVMESAPAGAANKMPAAITPIRYLLTTNAPARWAGCGLKQQREYAPAAARSQDMFEIRLMATREHRALGLTTTRERDRWLMATRERRQRRKILQAASQLGRAQIMLVALGFMRMGPILAGSTPSMRT